MRRPWLALLLLLAVAVALKAAYLLEYSALPFLRGPIADSVIYLEQARAIRAGRFDDPTLLAFSPLYGYFLALFTSGSPSHLPVLVQLVLGCVNLYLVYRLGEQLVSVWAGLISASLYLGYGLLLFYESKLLSETLGLTLALFALSLYLSPGFREGRWRHSIGCGAALGLAVLARASLLFSTPFFVLASILPWSAAGPAWSRRIHRTTGVAAGLAMILAANGVWNQYQSGLFVPVILVSQTVSATTSKPWSGDLGVLKQGDRSGGWNVVNQAEERLRRQRAGDLSAGQGPAWNIDFWGLLRGAPAKLYRAFWNDEITFQYGYQGERSELRSISLMPVSFGMLLLLGVVGAISLVVAGRHRELVPLLPLLAGALLTVMVYHPSSRYRLPMVLPLLLLSGQGLLALWRADRRLRVPALIIIGTTCMVLGYRNMTYRLQNPVRWEITVAQSAAGAGWSAETSRRLERAAGMAPGNKTVEERSREIRELLTVRLEEARR